MLVEPKNKPVNLNPLSPFKIFSAPPFFPVQPHFHPQFELMYFVDDEIEGREYSCNSTKYILKKGDIIVVNPNQVHSIDFTSFKSKIICLIVGKEVFPGISGQFYKNHIQDNYELQTIFSKIYDSVQKGTSTDVLKAISYIYSFFAILSEKYVDKEEKKNNFDKIKKALEYIDENFSGDISVSELADVLGLSYSRFYHLFKEVVGKSLTTYITGVRISKAQDMLLIPSLSIQEIAINCGFNSAAYFTKVFKDELSVTPKEYREIYQGL